MSDDLVRVRLENGAEKSVGADYAEAAGFEVLDESAYRGDGTVKADSAKDGRPIKPHTTVAERAAAKKQATSPASTAEEATA